MYFCSVAGSTPEPRHRICADDEQCAEFAVGRGGKHLGLRLAGRRRACPDTRRECAGRGDRNIAGKQVGEAGPCRLRRASWRDRRDRRSAHCSRLQAPGQRGFDDLAPRYSWPKMTTSDSSASTASRKLHCRSPVRAENTQRDACSRRREAAASALAWRSSLIGFGIGNVEPRPIEADVGAQIPGQQRMLFSGIAADEQNRRSARRCRAGWPPCPCVRQARWQRPHSPWCARDRCCWSAERCARTSAAGSSLRWWCGWSR